VSPSIIGVGRQCDYLLKICGIYKHDEQVVLCFRSLLGELTALHKPARFKWAARREGKAAWRGKEGRGRGKREREG